MSLHKAVLVKEAQMAHTRYLEREEKEREVEEDEVEEVVSSPERAVSDDDFNENEPTEGDEEEEVGGV